MRPPGSPDNSTHAACPARSGVCERPPPLAAVALLCARGTRGRAAPREPTAGCDFEHGPNGESSVRCGPLARSYTVLASPTVAHLRLVALELAHAPDCSSRIARGALHDR